MKYVVTDKGPIDKLPPGTDVTGRYSSADMALLVNAGYVEAVPGRKAKKKKGSGDGA